MLSLTWLLQINGDIGPSDWRCFSFSHRETVERRARVCLESIKIFHALFGQSYWQVRDKCVFHNLTLTHPQILHRKSGCPSSKNHLEENQNKEKENKPVLQIPVQITPVGHWCFVRFPKPCPHQDLYSSYKSSHGKWGTITFLRE